VREELIVDWLSNEDVIAAGVASSLVPFAINGLPAVWFRGGLVLDGAMTNVTGVRQPASSSSTHRPDQVGRNVVEDVFNLTWDVAGQVIKAKEALCASLAALSEDTEVRKEPSQESYGLLHLLARAGAAVAHSAAAE